uniref:Uncharacterized protein n=1 Tax=Arundo donax TaxID=35708 RepID=A0A0A9EPS1_ARUDO
MAMGSLNTMCSRGYLSLRFVSSSPT